MSEVIAFSRARDDTMWAVMDNLGKQSRVAEIYPTRIAALADRAWREQQVRAFHISMLSSGNFTAKPMPGMEAK